MPPLELRRAAGAYARSHPQASLTEAFIAGCLFAGQCSDDDAIPHNQRIIGKFKQDESLFEEVWNLYQRKDNKQSALKEWRKLTPEEKGRVFLHVPPFVQAHPDKKFRPMLATYLHQKRFLDEEIIDNGQSINSQQQQRLAAYADAINNVG